MSEAESRRWKMGWIRARSVVRGNWVTRGGGVAGEEQRKKNAVREPLSSDQGFLVV
jgi:hypothetical protein